MKELRFHGQAILTGRGAVEGLKDLPVGRAFIVTGGNSVVKNGMLDKITGILAAKGCQTLVLSGVPKNPPVETVVEGIARMRDFAPDTVIGVGGGSALDAAKAMSVFYEHPELDVAVAWRQAIPQKREKIKLIAIPGTSGTASEVTCFSVLTFKNENLKVGGKSAAFVPDWAILDVDMTLSMPKNVAAETGMDAMAHAVECYTNPALDDFTEAMAAGAVAGLYEHLPASCLTGEIAAREKVHNYQCLAGCAFANVGTGLDHGIAHAIGGRYDLGHGLVIAVALPYVLEFNARDAAVREKLARLARRIGRDDFVAASRELNAWLGIPASFRDLGISEAAFAADFAALVENALKGSTRFNPVPVSTDDMKVILRSIYEGRSCK